MKMFHIKEFKKFIKKFFLRLMKGQFKNSLYLTYYYCYLFFYDIVNKKYFMQSNSVLETGVPVGGTGNFPAHPRIVKMFLQKAKISKNDRILDVGSGNGIVLFVAYKLGFRNLVGIEYNKDTYNQSKINLSNKALLFHGNALNFDLSKVEVIIFFKPFKGNLAIQFFKTIPTITKTIILFNHDQIVEPIIRNLGFKEIFNYQHFIYKNFNGKIFKK